MTNYRELIINKVTKSTGIKSTDLSLSVMDSILPKTFNYEPYYTELMKAISDGEIVELDCFVNNDFKTMYFPKGTKLLVHASDYVLR